MAGRKELFCASSSPVTLSALINACCTETILHLFSLRSSCCPSDAAHAASSGQQLLLREKRFRIVSASSRRYMAGWKSYWTSISTEKLHLHIDEVFIGTFWKQREAECGQIHCPASSNFQTQFSTLRQTLPKMFMGSNIVVLYSAQYSVGCRTGRDRDCEIWTCKKTQAS